MSFFVGLLIVVAIIIIGYYAIIALFIGSIFASAKAIGDINWNITGPALPKTDTELTVSELIDKYGKDEAVNKLYKEYDNLMIGMSLFSAFMSVELLQLKPSKTLFIKNYIIPADGSLNIPIPGLTEYSIVIPTLNTAEISTYYFTPSSVSFWLESDGRLMAITRMDAYSPWSQQYITNTNDLIKDHPNPVKKFSILIPAEAATTKKTYHVPAWGSDLPFKDGVINAVSASDNTVIVPLYITFKIISDVKTITLSNNSATQTGWPSFIINEAVLNNIVPTSGTTTSGTTTSGTTTSGTTTSGTTTTTSGP